ncbi:MAG: iron-sulfur cluster-binding protein [Chloroflexi bacterium]|nr:iron-sulfur cluster-binding protein [Chloroflexota bacterium]
MTDKEPQQAKLEMPPITPPRVDFRKNSQHIDPHIPVAIQRSTARLVAVRSASVAQIPEWETLRQTAHDIRLHTLDHLAEYITQVEQQITRAGGHIHHARDAAEANAIVVEIARQHKVKTVVKGKSMASEEIGLNHALEHAGVRAVETDVGEFIIQLADVRPSHILGPAMHMTKEEIATLFTQKLGVEAPPNPRRLTDIAREQLREIFLRAEMGVTGANFIVAETGTVVLVTNEGNGRMCTTLPDVHVAVAGIDKIIPDWNALATLLPMLVRNATGQKLSSCTSFITGARRSDGHGPREFHLVLLDNGRTNILRDPLARETLLCIRCAACLNICPVYNQVGGHAYGGVYSGPIGAILSPQLLGMRVARDLPFASTLCGACVDVCPVKIPIPKILLHLRHRIAEGDAQEQATIAKTASAAAKWSARALSTPSLYRLGSQLAHLAQIPFRRGAWLRALPPPLNRWTQARPLPAVNATFRRWWKKRKLEIGSWKLEIGRSRLEVENRRSETATTDVDEIDQLIGEVNRLAGKAQRVSEQQIGEALKQLVEIENIKSAALWATSEIARLNLAECLRASGVAIIPHDADKHAIAQADLGITGVDFALAESGTLGLFSSPDKPRAISLLPRVHLVLVHPNALCSNLAQVFDQVKREDYAVFITGPSRTSDIESNPVVGAHGPKSLYVWVVS